ncbi:MAG: UpxY family transcription antiterminator [Vicinamibacterales bacterium]
MSTDWFAVRTRSRAERVVNDQLLRKNLEVFLPTITRWSRWKDRRKAVDWPLFPGYCFARFDPEQSLSILTCTGVASIVAFGEAPAPIPHDEIESIRLLVSSKLQFDPVPFIKEGDPVEVVSGPLKGARGRLVKKGQKARLLLSIELIGRMVSAEVDAADVRLG